VDDKLTEKKAEKTKMDEELWESREKLKEITNKAKQISKERQQLQRLNLAELSGNNLKNI